MGKCTFFLWLSLLLFLNTVSGQFAEPCGTEKSFQEAARLHPDLLLRRQAAETYISNFIKKKQASRITSEPLRIIPVVFHIIHEGGPENISKAQIDDQMRILNEDYRRKNSDTVNTPAAFRSRAADCNIEFRLATKDPKGNCTDGINRVYSHLTNNVPHGSQDTVVKYLSVWDNTRYLNIWVIKNFVGKGPNRTLLGFAQFPDAGPSALDGVMVVANTVGSIGSAENGNGGRVATHEIGHWLNLHHIWGDAHCGDDLVADTPAQDTSNFGCPSFPHISCGGAGGDMFTNYMDYTNGSCQNIYTKGQKLRMDATLSDFRSLLVSKENLIFTGTSTSGAATLCPPTVRFSARSKLLCAGDSVLFSDGSYNGVPTKLNWSFEGGQPTASSAANVMVQYPDSGNFTVKLYAENAAGKDSLIVLRMVHVSGAKGISKQLYTENFDGSSWPDPSWVVTSEGQDHAWMKTSEAAFTGTNSLKINNFSGNPPSALTELVSPVLDVSGISSPGMSFRIAYGQKEPSLSDKLSVFYSTDCGKIWLPVFSKSGDILASNSGGLKYTYYVPGSASEWRLESFDLLISPAKRTRVRVKFQFISGGGNNIYIDDIRIGNLALGIAQNTSDLLNIRIDPNPGTVSTQIQFDLAEAGFTTVKLYDLFGQVVTSVVQDLLSPGHYDFLLTQPPACGIYYLKFVCRNVTQTKKVVFN